MLANCARLRSAARDAFLPMRSPRSSRASWKRPPMPKKPRERRRRGDGTVSVAKYDANGKPILWKASISLGTVTIDGKARRNRPTEYADTEKEAYQKLQRLQAKH